MWSRPWGSVTALVGGALELGHPKRKLWSQSWKDPVTTLTLKGRSFERELVVLSIKGEPDRPEQLLGRVEGAIVERPANKSAPLPERPRRPRHVPEGLTGARTSLGRSPQAQQLAPPHPMIEVTLSGRAC
jgi:hypothetical protein